MKKYIYIKADTNDGDYISTITLIKEEDLKQLMPVIEAIKANSRSHNWGVGEYADTQLEEQYPNINFKLLEWFNEYVPYGEYGVHTIETIEIYEVTSKTVLL